jgi:hypothetical protein
MYLKKDYFVCILSLTETAGSEPDPLVRGNGSEIRIRTKMSPFRNTDLITDLLVLILQKKHVKNFRKIELIFDYFLS